MLYFIMFGKCCMVFLINCYKIAASRVVKDDFWLSEVMKITTLK